MRYGITICASAMLLTSFVALGQTASVGDVVAVYRVQEQLPNDDIQLYGAQSAYDKYFVTGRNGGPDGPQQIYWFDADGNYEGQIDQFTESGNWGQLDLAAREVSGDQYIYAGAENGEFAYYMWDGSTLIPKIRINASQLGYIRALAYNPNTDRFFCGDSTNSLYSFKYTHGNSYVSDVKEHPNIDGANIVGLAYDYYNDKLWAWCQENENGENFYCHAYELVIDGNGDAVKTGVEFHGERQNSAKQEAAGGASIGDHPDNPGKLSMFTLHQVDGTDSDTPQDSIVVYDVGESTNNLIISGICPGPIYVDLTHGVPGARCAFIYSSSLGSTPIPPCPGLYADLNRPSLWPQFIKLDGNGEFHTGLSAAPGMCGKLVQMVDITNCALSNVAIIP